MQPRDNFCEGKLGFSSMYVFLSQAIELCPALHGYMISISPC